jgi:hypothetical protein
MSRSYNRVHELVLALKALNRARLRGGCGTTHHLETRLWLLDVACGYRKPATVIIQSRTLPVDFMRGLRVRSSADASVHDLG